MTHPTMPFSQCLAALIQERHLTISECARMLGYKSKTTLIRVLQGQAGLSAVTRVYHDLAHHLLPALTDEELSRLEAAYLALKNGPLQASAHREMWNLLKSIPPEKNDLPLVGSDETTTLSELLGRLAQSGHPLRALLIGPGCPDILVPLTESARTASLTLEHYFSTDMEATAIIRGVAMALALLHNPGCTAFTLDHPPAELAEAGLLLLTDGVTEAEIHFDSPDSGHLLFTENRESYWKAALAQASCQPIRCIKSSDPESLISFTDNYRRLEEKRNLYKFKPDLCINYIRENIVKAAFEDGYRALGQPIPRQAIDVLLPLQKKRYDNLISQKRASHLVLSERAMRSFAQTGRLSDHPFMLRPFSVMERIEILSLCINELETNPFYHIYLLNEEDDCNLFSASPVEMICYDGACVQLTPAITDYNFQTGHAEVFIDQPAFMKICHDFFQNELLKNHTQPPQRTVAFFKTLISELSRTLE